MNDKLVSYALAVLAKVKGFDEVTSQNYDLYNQHLHPDQVPPVLKNYNAFSNTTGRGKIVSAPTQSLLQLWLRENKGIVCYVSFTRNSSVLDKTYEYFYVGHIKFANDESPMVRDYAVHRLFKTYEDALENILQESLNMLP